MTRHGLYFPDQCHLEIRIYLKGSCLGTWLNGGKVKLYQVVGRKRFCMSINTPM